MSLRTKMIHWKIRWFGNKYFEKKGTAVIPCKICGSQFQSYLHYGEWYYTCDDSCEDCAEHVTQLADGSHWMVLIFIAWFLSLILTYLNRSYIYLVVVLAMIIFWYNPDKFKKWLKQKK